MIFRNRIPKQILPHLILLSSVFLSQSSGKHNTVVVCGENNPLPAVLVYLTFNYSPDEALPTTVKITSLVQLCGIHHMHCDLLKEEKQLINNLVIDRITIFNQNICYFLTCQVK